MTVAKTIAMTEPERRAYNNEIRKKWYNKHKNDAFFLQKRACVSRRYYENNQKYKIKRQKQTKNYYHGISNIIRIEESVII